MNKILILSGLLVTSCTMPEPKIDLSGRWGFTTDTTRWENTILLPGSMTSNLLGDDPSLETPWTGTIIDSAFFHQEQYAKYRTPDNFKVPFWLQPVKYYRGEAWYRRSIEIPEAWSGSDLMMTLERCHWDTELWIDGRKVGEGHSLGVPHRFDLTRYATPGSHELLLKVDNSLSRVNPGVNSHSVTDHTQGNWNGVIGRMEIEALPRIRVEHLAVYPDVETKRIKARVELQNSTPEPQETLVSAQVGQAGTEQPVRLSPGTTAVELELALGDTVALWNEFNPALYELAVELADSAGTLLHAANERFGMREIESNEGRILLNGRRIFLRGMLDCAAYPLTGYPPMEREAWVKLYTNCRNHGLNHVRFHSWCPPEVAFDVADEMGIYLQVECSSWANQGVTIGDGAPLDRFVWEESERMVREYGNHPSFCMLLYGNEPAGEGSNAYLQRFVCHWKEKDGRRIYSTSGGWPNLPVNDFLNDPTPRVQGWGQGLNSIINAEAPRTDYDWNDYVSKHHQPIVSHEIGQWCVYPNFREIDKYIGVMRARNFEIFRDQLAENGMLHLADSFLMASGKLQALCYKADIEAALRTKNFGGFQLLGLYDFPGQGTALVGVLDVFGDEKGYITPEAYRRFCAPTVPLVRMPRMIYDNTERLKAHAEVAHFGADDLENVEVSWRLTDCSGRVLVSDNWTVDRIPTGENCVSLGEIDCPLSDVDRPSRLKLELTVGGYVNDWNIWVYPEAKGAKRFPDDILVTDCIDSRTIDSLEKGGKVLLTVRQGELSEALGGDIKVGFSSIFWNTAWTEGQAPHTLGILCDPDHPALKSFPTEYHSDYQWWDAMHYGSAIEIDKLSQGAQPIVRIIDDWFTNRPLALIAEFRIGEGRILLSGVDFTSEMDVRPAGRQLLASLLDYMESPRFDPDSEISISDLQLLFR